ncbi:MAG: UDP-N-acetylmuramoyl-tripeptide--D-alanyl-D-alanine ligase [Deltaproteobacteria bacterium]|nr:UDP-N-acetylmuramoyl-tripeptide--D-alanyl-D-alanine ligase [Deltaproteobacteria bacterium]
MTARWGNIKVEDIISPLKGRLAGGNPGLPVTGVSTDSREILKGCIFFALKGERFDGHDFAVKAMEQGASCIVINKGYRIDAPSEADAAIIAVEDTLKALGELASWWRHQFDVKVAAITGSAGKTTTKEMTAAILEMSTRTLKNRGNLNNLIGLPMTVFRLEEGVSRMVLEMGMNMPGEIRRLTEIADPDVGLITNVGYAHLEGLGDIEGVARAKTELLEKMSPEGRVILNGDDDILMKTAKRFKRDFMTFGLKQENDVRAEGVRNLGKDGISFKLCCRGSYGQVLVPLPGMHNLLNALAAASVAMSMGEPFENISEGLKRYEGLNGRFKTIQLADDIILVDDTYNSNPSSLRAALDAVRDMAAGAKRVIVGLGEMMELGDKTTRAHSDAGRMVADIGASWFFAMGEHAGDMIRGAVESGLTSGKAVGVAAYGDMIAGIDDILRPGDIVFLKASRRMGLDAVARGLQEKRSREV